MKQDTISQNPWAGLSSYEDPAKSKQNLKFCGRDSETKEVTRLIDDNFFVTLYGKSGIGKTSLLNAGVFPSLRHEQYTPLSLRLGMSDETQTFQDIITAAIEHAVAECGGSVRVINVLEAQTDHSAIDYLWNWFARHSFLMADGHATFPVIVLDQFEEVFRHQNLRKKAEVLLTQLHYLIDESHALNDCIVNGEPYCYDFNFRFVLSIREDDLYRLEDSIDNCALTALKRCRYRLRSLSEQGARKVVLIPGEGLFNEKDQELIVDKIIKVVKNKEDEYIGTNSLSLICSRLYYTSLSTGQKKLSVEIVDNFVASNPFEKYYFDVTQKLREKEKKYIENHMIDSSGRRNSISEADYNANVPNGQYLLCGDSKIFQKISISSNSSNDRVELIHDSFCDTLYRQKLLRQRNTTEHMALVFVYLLIFLLWFQIVPISYWLGSYCQSWQSVMIFTPLLLPFILPIITIGFIRNRVLIDVAIIGCFIAALPFVSLSCDIHINDVEYIFHEKEYLFMGYSEVLTLLISTALILFFVFLIFYQKKSANKKKTDDSLDRINYSYMDLFVSPTNRTWLFLLSIVLLLITCFNLLPVTVNPKDVFLLSSLIVFTLFEHKNTKSVWIIAGFLLFETMISYADVSIDNKALNVLILILQILSLFILWKYILPEISAMLNWRERSGCIAFLLFEGIMLLYKIPFENFSFGAFFSRSALTLYNYLFVMILIGVYIYKYSSITKRARVFASFSMASMIIYLLLKYSEDIKQCILDSLSY